MNARPWPIVLLSALGAWVVAIPVFFVIALLLEPLLRHQPSIWLVGTLMLIGAIVMLRAAQREVFVENLAPPIFMVGLGLIGWSLHDLFPLQSLCVALSLLTLALTLVVPQAWIRGLLGGFSAVFLLQALSPLPWLEMGDWRLSPWLAMHLLVALWVSLIALTHSSPKNKTLIRALDEAGKGWVTATLLALTWSSGSTFLLSQSLHLDGIHPTDVTPTWWAPGGIDLAAAAVALLAMVVIAWQQPQWRQAWCVGLALVACGLAAFMPMLSGALLIVAVCWVTQRQRLAVLAALVGLWVIGAFYYQLAWPLAYKAAILMLAGALLATLAAWGKRTITGQEAHADPRPRLTPTRLRGMPIQQAWGLALSLLATLWVANASIWKNETIIRHGRTVYVALAPVDPRSLMQGDYMALRFDLGNVNLSAAPHNQPIPLVFKIDSSGIATALRQDQGEPIQKHELIMHLRRHKGEWQLVTDAFYFKEGEGNRWAEAQFGELRVDAKGRALLVSLRGANLKPL